MTNAGLKKLINECIQEVVAEQNMEEGWFGDKLKSAGKALGVTGGGPDSGASHYDRFTKMHDKRVDHEKKGSYDKFQNKQKAEDKIEKIKSNFDEKLKKSMRDSFIEGEAVGMTRAEIKKMFMSSIGSILNKYKRLEEDWNNK